MSKVTWIDDAPVLGLGAVTPAGWFDSGCGAGPRARWLPDGSVEIEGEGVPVKALPKDVAQWKATVAQAAAKHGVPPQFVTGVMATESGGNPVAHSFCCYGLMGLLPSTASDQAGRTVAVSELVGNPALNVDLGAKLLGSLFKKYGGNVVRIAAAYNAGSPKCGSGKCGAPNRWNLVADCVQGKAVDYSGRVIGFTNAAVKAGVGSAGPVAPAGGSGWSTWQLALGAVSLAVVGLAVFKPGVLRGAAGMLRANPSPPATVKSIHAALVALKPSPIEEFAGGVWDFTLPGNALSAGHAALKALGGWRTLSKSSTGFNMRKSGAEVQMIKSPYSAITRVTVDTKAGATEGRSSNPVDELLIRRAASILQYASPEEAAEILVESEDLSQEDAHLAVRAGELLLKDREGRSSW